MCKLNRLLLHFELIIAVLFFLLLVMMFDLILAYESDELDNDQIVKLFQQIYDSKAYLWLQGHYERTLDHLIDSGLINTYDLEEVAT